MYEAIRKAARRQRRVLLQDIESRLDAGEEVELANLHKKLDALASAEILRTPFERAFISAIPVLVALLLLGILWLLRQGDPTIELSAQVSRVAIMWETDDKLELGGLGQVYGFRAEGLDFIESDSGVIDYNNGRGSGTVLTTGPVTVSRIDLTPARAKNEKERVESSLAISKRGNLGQLEVRNFKLSARADLLEAATLTSFASGQTREANLSDAMLELAGPGGPQSRVRLFFGLGERTVNFPVMKPDRLVLRDLAFDEQGNRETFSSIRQANLVFVGAGRKHEILRGTSLALGKLDGNLRVTLGPEVLEITYHGKAGLVGLGGEPDAPIRDLRPSLAEWISSDRTIALVWSSLLFVVGLVLTVRRSLLG